MIPKILLDASGRPKNNSAQTDWSQKAMTNERRGLGVVAVMNGKRRDDQPLRRQQYPKVAKCFRADILHVGR